MARFLCCILDEKGKVLVTPLGSSGTITKEYYKKRPCGQLVGMAAAIMESAIEIE